MNGKSKTILMLGGSAQQVVAIKKAKELGYRTVVCDYLPDNPGQFEADAFFLESTTDKEKMLEIAEKEHVGGVLAYSSDPASPTAAFVASRLGLPTNPPESIEIMSFKDRFRSHLRKSGLPCPQTISFDVTTTAPEVEVLVHEFRWPLVIKPTDSSGSKGVTMVDSPNELPDALQNAKRFSRNGKLIAEEYIRASFPYVIGGDIFVVDGKVRFWGLMSCLRDGASRLVPCGKMAPTRLSKGQMGNVKSVLQRLVSSLEIAFGELNVEVIIGDNDVPYVLELASRAGGNMIPVQLSDISGVDLVAANILSAMGENPGILDYNTEDAEPFLTYVLHTNQDGILHDIKYSSLAESATYRSVLYVNKGDSVKSFDGANKALGIMFMRFESDSDMRSFVDNPSGHVRVEVVAE